MKITSEKALEIKANDVRKGVIEAVYAAQSGHPDMKKVPGVDMTTRSLGQGLSVAVGMALGSKMDNAGCKVYCLLGDCVSISTKIKK